jgi:hypothetical protein
MRSKGNFMSRGIKFNSGKPRMSLIPFAPLREFAKVLTYGEIQYETHNWKKGIPFSELIDATERHIGKFKDGVNLDDESGLHHLAHAMFGLVCTMWFMWRNKHRDDDGKLLDDRYKRDSAGWGKNFDVTMNEPPRRLKDITNDAS